MNICSDSREVAEATKIWLDRRGVKVEEIAELVVFLQHDYFPGLTKEDYLPHVEKVLSKREVQNAVLTGIQLDVLAEENKLGQPILDIIRRDESLYGCDEVLALSILNVYGSIGLTNYGHIDKIKPGILQRLNDKSKPGVNTFLDDIVGAIAAAASSRIAHRQQAEQEKNRRTSK